GLQSNHARPQSLEKRQRSRTRKSFAHGDLTAPVHPVDLHDSLGNVEPDHGNVHVDGSSVSDSDNHHSGTPDAVRGAVQPISEAIQESQRPTAPGSPRR